MLNLYWPVMMLSSNTKLSEDSSRIRQRTETDDVSFLVGKLNGDKCFASECTEDTDRQHMS